jgi:hypothetical protein
MAGGDLGALAAAHIRWLWMAECPCSHGWRERDLVRCPVSGVAFITEFANSAYVKTPRWVILRPGLGERLILLWRWFDEAGKVIYLYYLVFFTLAVPEAYSMARK